MWGLAAEQGIGCRARSNLRVGSIRVARGARVGPEKSVPATISLSFHPCAPSGPISLNRCVVLSWLAKECVQP